LTKLVGARINNGAGQVDWQVVKRLWAGSLPTTGVVVILMSWGHALVKVEWLTMAIGVVILITASGLILAPKLAQMALGRRIEDPAKFKHLQPGLTVFIDPAQLNMNFPRFSCSNVNGKRKCTKANTGATPRAAQASREVA